MSERATKSNRRLVIWTSIALLVAVVVTVILVDRIVYHPQRFLRDQLSSLGFAVGTEPAIPVDNVWFQSNFFRVKQVVYLGKHPVPSEAFALIGRADHLEALVLDDAEFDPVDLAAIEHSGSLRYLSFADSSMNDVGMRSVAKLKKIDMLILSSTNVTDDGLSELKELESVGELAFTTSGPVGGTKEINGGMISLDAVEQLKKRFPKMVVH
ncbi:MAG: hypothetical protein GC159_01285 [Phycisphaera sp.]|nr:hypothetical protein [Phycisphaera sp.]